MFSGHRDRWIEGRDFHNDKEQKQFERLQHPDNDAEEDQEEQPNNDGDERNSCSSSTGCGMVFRPEPTAGSWLYDDDPEDDPRYEYQTASEHETLEYDSEASDHEAFMEDDNMDVDNNSGNSILGVDGWLFQVSGSQGPQGAQTPEFDTEFLPLDTPLGAPLYFRTETGGHQVNLAAHARASQFEHVAGLGCRNSQAYIGKRISTDEMRGCHTVQAILRKPPGSKSRSDDLEFERGSDYFLTGIAEMMPSSGAWLDCYPVRYGADNYVEAETDFVLEMVSFPFYPCCSLHLCAHPR